MIFITSLAFHPARFSDNSLLISANFCPDTSGGLPVLGRFFNPSRPNSAYLFTHLYAHHLDRWNSFSAILAVCSLSTSTRLTNRSLSLTSPFFSVLYASSNNLAEETNRYR